MLRKTLSGIMFSLILISMTELLFPNQAIRADQQVCILLETDKHVYTLGENVTITLTNNGSERVDIGGYPAWQIFTYPEEEPVYPAIFAFLEWHLDPRENDTFVWNQINEFNQSSVNPGAYVVRDTQGWGISAHFEIVAAEIIVPDDYPTIQGAINAANSGDTIFVKAGTYHENVVVNKTVSLIGENRSNTIIDGMHKGDVVHISADNVVVSRFTIINSKNQGGYAGINSYNIKNCSIRENNILSNWRGIWLYNCTNNIIHDNSISNTTESLAIWVHYANSTVISSNIVTNNPSGIYLYYSDNNVVRRNSITDNNYYGLTLTESKGNLIIENVIANNSEWDGVALWHSCHNTVTANNILNNPHGLRFGFSSNNTIYHNNFINNAIQVYDTYREYDSEPSINTWDDGYPSGGNYWSDYPGVDLYSGPHQNETGSDGIGDESYVISGNAKDNYPLMDPYDPLIIKFRVMYYALLEKYNELVKNYNALNSTYYELIDIYGTLLADYGNLNSTYYTLLSNYTELQGNYDFLQTSYNNLQANFNSLNSTYNNLLSDYNNLQSSYNQLSSSYTSLQESYNELQSDQEAIMNELSTIRYLMYIFMATTIVLVATTVYFAERKPR